MSKATGTNTKKELQEKLKRMEKWLKTPNAIKEFETSYRIAEKYCKYLNEKSKVTREKLQEEITI